MILRAIIAWLLLTVAAHADPISIGAAATAIGTWWASIGIVGQAVVQLAVGLALYGISSVLLGSSTKAKSDRLATVNVPQRDGLLDQVRIYGTDTTPGGVFFQKTTSSNQIYVLGVAVSQGICDGLVSVIINGVECLFDSAGNPLTAPWNEGGNLYCKVSFRSGTNTQAIDPIIAARFPSEDVEFRQRGIATVVMEMAFGNSQDHHTRLWGVGGIPQLLYRIRGVRIFDPRDPTQVVGTRSTYKWSDNATLIEADWLMTPMGFDIPAAELDWSGISYSANVDDQIVATLAGTERRGRINGRVISDEENDSVLRSMRLMNRADIWKSEGLYHIRAEDGLGPTSTLYQDLLVGDIGYRNEVDTRSAINTVRVTYQPASKYNQRAETAYQDATLVSLDGEVFEEALTLRFCDSSAAAQRLGYGMVVDNRAGKSLSQVLDIASLYAAGKPNLALERYDIARVEMRNYPEIGGIYKIQELEISSTEFTVSLTMSEYNADAIDGWNVSMEVAS